MEPIPENLQKMAKSHVDTKYASLGAKEESFRSLVNGIYDYAVFTTDTNGFIQSWNPGAVIMKGYSADEAIGSHFSMLYPKEGIEKDEPMQHLAKALIDGYYKGEGLRRKKNGELFLADVYIRPIYKDGVHIGFAKVVANLNEKNKFIHKLNESRLEIQDLKEERAERAKFVSSLTHDLRSPLTMARMSAEMLLKKPEGLEGKIQKIISYIDRTDKMIKDLLDTSKIQVGSSLHLSPTQIDLKQILQEVCEGFLLKKENLVELQCPENIIGHWDASALRRIFENLINNALKHGNQKEEVRVTAYKLKDLVVIEVHNYGNIIKTEDQESIFNQYHQIDSASSSQQQGWGLGLTLVKGLTEAHGGQVKVKSMVIEGTTFTIELPIDCR